MKLAALKRLDLILGHVLIFTLRPFALLAGKLLRRDHGLEDPKHLVVLKMLGGGSLIIAAPALIALRRRFPDARMTLVCTHGVKSYAGLLHIFDDYAIVETSAAWRVLRSSLRAIKRSWRADTIIE